MPTIPVILDVDTGVDDALAILFAVAHPDIEVLGISCVAGNASLERVVDNTLRILDVAGAPDIPVAAGARRPLIEPARAASHVHGEGGLGTVHLPPSDRTADAGQRRRADAHAAQGQPRARSPSWRWPRRPTSPCCCASTPTWPSKIERIVFMGGSASVGNATAVAEFNVWHDPEAAAIVLDSGVPTFMYGLDVFNQVAVDAGDRGRAARRSDDRRRAHRRRAAGQPRRRRQRGRDGPVHRAHRRRRRGLRPRRSGGAPHRDAARCASNSAGYGRGQTIVDMRSRPGEDACTAPRMSGRPSRSPSTSTPRASPTLFLDTLGLA